MPNGTSGGGESRAGQPARLPERSFGVDDVPLWCAGDADPPLARRRVFPGRDASPGPPPVVYFQLLVLGEELLDEHVIRALPGRQVFGEKVVGRDLHLDRQSLNVAGMVNDHEVLLMSRQYRFAG